MTNVFQATIAITGTRPLLWHRFGPEAIPLDGRREKTGVPGHDPEEWRRTVLMTPARQLYLDPQALFSCLRDGARYTPRRRSTLQPLVAATVQVLDERVLIDRYLPEQPTDDHSQPVYLDIRSVRNPSTRMRNVRYRVASGPGWRANFSIVWDVTIVNRNELMAVLVDAGRYVGLGDGRTIGFGRFVVDLDRDVTIVEGAR